MERFKQENNISTTIYPSENPGAHERHLIRRHENPLFGNRATLLSGESLRQIQKIDDDMLQQFMGDFHDVVNKTVNLKSNENSDIVLEVKAELDKLFAESSGVAGDQSKVQKSIKTLIDVVMLAIRKAAAHQPKILQQLDEEDLAREAHFAFLESKLVADLLNPDSPIASEDLLPTLLCAAKDDLALAMQLFDKQQMILLLEQGKQLVESVDVTANNRRDIAENYRFMQGYLKYLEQS